jgi:hypothetical protein
LGVFWLTQKANKNTKTTQWGKKLFYILKLRQRCKPDWKKKSWSKPIVPVYINGLWGPSSVYLLGVGWEAWDKTARPPVVKDHSFNLIPTESMYTGNSIQERASRHALHGRTSSANI